MMAGAAGHTYGNGNVWQMWSPKHKPLLGANTPWNEAIDHPGSFQMKHLSRLFASRAWEKLQPDPSFIMSPNPGASGMRIRAAVASDHSFAFVYLPKGEPVAVDMSRIGPGRMTAWWFDPRYGHAYEIYQSEAVAVQAFTPPTNGRGNDWVLVIDQGSRAFGAPGAVAK
jgi:hypothetical protein